MDLLTRNRSSDRPASVRGQAVGGTPGRRRALRDALGAVGAAISPAGPPGAAASTHAGADAEPLGPATVLTGGPTRASIGFDPGAAQAGGPVAAVADGRGQPSGVAAGVGRSVEEYLLNEVARPVAVDAGAARVDEAVHDAARSLGIGGVLGSVLDRSVDRASRSMLDRGADKVTRSVLSRGVPQAGGAPSLPPLASTGPDRPTSQLPAQEPPDGAAAGPQLTVADLIAASEAMRRSQPAGHH